MQVKGTIVEWKDDRGFGFIEPDDGGPKVFCHIKSFAIRVRRPMAGDAVTFRTFKDAQGRLQAADVRPVGLERATYNSNVGTRRASKPREVPANDSNQSGIAAYALVALFFIALIVLVASGRLTFFAPLMYAAVSGVTWFAYGFDKSAAMSNRWRTRERSLHILELAGGWPGALLAQRMFRHKSSKLSFRVEFWMCVAINLLALAIYTKLVPSERVVEVLRGFQ